MFRRSMTGELKSMENQNLVLSKVNDPTPGYRRLKYVTFCKLFAPMFFFKHLDQCIF